MKKLVVVTAATGLTLTGVGTAGAARRQATPTPTPAGESAQAVAAGVAWTPCPANDPIELHEAAGPGVRDAEGPARLRQADGRKISLALSRVQAPRARHYQGIMLPNPGGPGGSGLTLPRRLRQGHVRPGDAAATYDWIGFDPRASAPAVRR